MCLETSWYLACDFQMMLIGPVLVWTIWRFQVLGLILGFIVLAVACAIPGVIAGVNDLPPVMTYTILFVSLRGMHDSGKLLCDHKGLFLQRL